MLPRPIITVQLDFTTQAGWLESLARLLPICGSIIFPSGVDSLPGSMSKISISNHTVEAIIQRPLVWKWRIGVKLLLTGAYIPLESSNKLHGDLAVASTRKDRLMLVIGTHPAGEPVT